MALAARSFRRRLAFGKSVDTARGEAGSARVDTVTGLRPSSNAKKLRTARTERLSSAWLQSGIPKLQCAHVHSKPRHASLHTV
jgi:hypothetical protein